MEEVKKTRKKPAAKKDVQSTVDVAAEKLEKTQPEVAATAEPNTENVAEKPVKKKTTKKPAKSASTEQKAESDASMSKPKAVEEPKVVEEPKADTQAEASNADEQNPAEEPKTEEQVTEDKAEEQSAEEQEPVKAEEAIVTEQEPEKEELPIAATKKKKIVAQDNSKKFALSKKMIIILSCVLAAVIVAIVLAVTLTSCKSCDGGDNTGRKTYTVTFDTNGGSAIDSYTVYEGDKIPNTVPKPTKDMFDFVGWYLVNPNNPSDTQEFNFDSLISQDITLVAGWRGKNSVKVEFNANGGAFEKDKQVVLYGDIGSPMTAPTDEPARYGYKFGGWYEDVECKSKFDFGSFPIDNATLYAGWAADPDFGYVSYYGNGELLRTEPVKKTDNVVLPDDLFDDNIVVGNWCTDEDMTKIYKADKPTDELKLYTTYYTKGLTINNGIVTKYTGMATEVVVPTVYNGKPVSSIGADAFYRTSALPAITSVKLPNSIRSIGNGAFYNCQYLASINLTENVTTIGADAFYRNERLRTLGDISGLRSIGDNAFSGCKDLRDFEFGYSLMTIGDYAFNDCSMLTNVTITASVRSVGDYAFSGCSSLKSVFVESLVLDSIGNNAFADCTSLTEITLEKTSGAVEFGGNPIADTKTGSSLNVTIYVPSALLDAYKNNESNKHFKENFAAIG